MLRARRPSAKQVKHRICQCRNGPGYLLAKVCGNPVSGEIGLPQSYLCSFCKGLCQMSKGFNHTDFKMEIMFGDGF